MVDAVLTAGPTAADGRRPRIAYLTFGSGQYDARTRRMARSAIEAGYEVTVYARWYPGLPVTEDLDGYRLVRAPWDWRLAVPWLRRSARRRAAARMASTAIASAAGPGTEAITRSAATPGWARRSLPRRALARIGRPLAPRYRHWRRLIELFPLTPLGWAAGLGPVVEPADIWHGMWAGSLPALVRMRRRHGGRTIYDSRDVYMQSRDFAHAGQPGRGLLAWLERRWARAVDAVLTVNDAYADLLAAQLGVPRPRVVMNCPGRWTPPEPRPDHFRTALGLGPATAIVLYQGGLMTHRGIEQTMEAILDVPDAVLCLLGFGALRDELARRAAVAPYAGRVALFDPVSPDELLAWTASADISVMAIQPSSVNHRFTTPQKLFESLAAGVPVVASDLPGMAGIVTSSGAGVLCDPTDPASIAAGIRSLLEAPPEDRAARRAMALAAAHDRYTWESQVETLLGLYRELRSR